MASLSIPAWLSEYDNDEFESSGDSGGSSVLNMSLLTPSSVPASSRKLKKWENLWRKTLKQYYSLENPTDCGPVYSCLEIADAKYILSIVDCEKVLGGKEKILEVELDLEELCECTRIFLMSQRHN